MSKNIMTSGIEMADVIKSTGFPVPEDMEGKTFAEVVEGGGSGDITVEALTATENKVYTAPKGKAYSPVTVNVPSADLEANKSATIDVSQYSAPVEITPTEGKDGFKKATVTLTDIPSAPTTMYCWVDNLDPHEDKAFCVIPNPKVGDQVFWTDADGVYSVITINAVTETTLTTDRGTLTRDSTEDVVLVN
jgi:hypothetical protein